MTTPNPEASETPSKRDAPTRPGTAYITIPCDVDYISLGDNVTEGEEDALVASFKSTLSGVLDEDTSVISYEDRGDVFHAYLSSTRRQAATFASEMANEYLERCISRGY